MKFDQAIELYKAGVFKHSLLKKYIDKREYLILLKQLQELELTEFYYIEHFKLIDKQDSKYCYKTLELSDGTTKQIRSSNLTKAINKYLNENKILTYKEHLVESILEDTQSLYTLNY